MKRHHRFRAQDHIDRQPSMPAVGNQIDLHAHGRVEVEAIDGALVSMRTPGGGTLRMGATALRLILLHGGGK